MPLAEQGLINHVALVLDRSSSMDHLTSKVVEVADGLIRYLAERSTELNQETRVSVYQFADAVENSYYDKDVLRLPSLVGKYRPYGNTALIDGTFKAIEDLKKTATLYGDHAFLTYVLTDGVENRSRYHGRQELKECLRLLKDNWTVAALVPNITGERYCQDVGFYLGNIAIWDTTVDGLGKAANVVQQATESYMQARAAGIRGTRSLFTLDPSRVVTSDLIEIDKRGYKMYPVLPAQSGQQIRDFVTHVSSQPYKKGMAYYELTKTEEIQPRKQLVVLDKKKNVIYSGPNARQMLGLPHDYVKVKPLSHPDYRIFIQSMSVNRKLVAGQNVLVF